MKFFFTFQLYLVFLFCFIWQNAYSQLLYPDVIISPEVEKWMNEQLSGKSEKKTVEMKTDVLGRVKSSSDKTGLEVKVVEGKQKRLVVISDMSIPQIDIEPMHGHSEYNPATKGYNYYLNDKMISLKEYENLMEKHWKKFDSQSKSKRNLPIPGVISSDSRIWNALLTAEEIYALAKNYKELAISDYIEPVNEALITDILRTIQISTHAWPNNYTGNGVGVGVVEPSCASPAIPMFDSNRYTDLCSNLTPNIDPHHTKVVNVVQQASPHAHIFAFRANVPYPIPDSYSPPLQVVTYSYGYPDDKAYSDKDRDMDNYIYNHRIIGFKAAGNTGNYVTSPGKALNIITVGAVCPGTQCLGYNEVMYNYTKNDYTNYSSWRNSEIGNEKPEAAIYTDIEMGKFSDYKRFDGTSASTPLLAGFMANLLDECTFCRRQPAMMKAAIINAENIPIPNARSWDLDNFKSAQGIVDFSSIAWNGGEAWWDGDNSDFFDFKNEIIHIENNVNAGRHHKITISWLSLGTYIYKYQKIQQDLNLYVYQNNQLLASSTSDNDPFETVTFVAPTNAPLRIVIRRVHNGGGRVILGYSIRYL